MIAAQRQVAADCPIGLSHKPTDRLLVNYTHHRHLLSPKADTRFTVPWRDGRLRPWPRPVLLIALLLIARAAYGAAGCKQGHHSDLASVSLSD